jgi:type VI secretion system protein ImpM
MSKGILSSHQVGLFGKLPMTGDFLSRGLPTGLRPVFDRWLTAKFTLQEKNSWPQSGYRGAFAWNEAVVCALVMPSHDKLGRNFPLSVCFVVPPNGVSVAGIDQWCDAALPPVIKALGGFMSAEELLDQVRQIPLQQGASDLPELPVIWSKTDQAPVSSD